MKMNYKTPSIKIDTEFNGQPVKVDIGEGNFEIVGEGAEILRYYKEYFGLIKEMFEYIKDVQEFDKRSYKNYVAERDRVK